MQGGESQGLRCSIFRVADETADGGAMVAGSISRGHSSQHTSPPIPTRQTLQPQTYT